MKGEVCRLLDTDD